MNYRLVKQESLPVSIAVIFLRLKFRNFLFHSPFVMKDMTVKKCSRFRLALS